MKLLTTIDHCILSYWNTEPSERVWAYPATFVPLTALIIGTVAQFTN